MFAKATYEIARKEFLQHWRTKRVLIVGIGLLATMTLMTVILPLSFGFFDDEPPEQAAENLVMELYLGASLFGGIFFIQLLSVVMASDSISGEWSHKTLFLVLSKPVPRGAFVLGKFLGTLATVLPIILVVFCVMYGILQPLYAGAPTGEEVLRFLGAILLLCLGAATITAVAVFFSSVSRSSVQSMVFMLIGVLLVFPALGSIGDFVYLSDSGEERGELSDARYDWSHYVSPERVLFAAQDLMVDHGDEEGDYIGGTFILPQYPPDKIWLSILSSVGLLGIFLGSAMVVVSRRNYD